MSESGTSEPSPDVRYEAAFGGNSDIEATSPNGPTLDPEPT
jgi:hypothetical protein